MITNNSLYIADILSFRITSMSLAFTRFTHPRNEFSFLSWRQKFTASLLDAQHWRDSVKNDPVSLLVVPLVKARSGIPPSWCGRPRLPKLSVHRYPWKILWIRSCTPKIGEDQKRSSRPIKQSSFFSATNSKVSTEARNGNPGYTELLKTGKLFFYCFSNRCGPNLGPNIHIR